MFYHYLSSYLAFYVLLYFNVKREKLCNMRIRICERLDKVGLECLFLVLDTILSKELQRFGKMSWHGIWYDITMLCYNL